MQVAKWTASHTKTATGLREAKAIAISACVILAASYAEESLVFPQPAKTRYRTDAVMFAKVVLHTSIVVCAISPGCRNFWINGLTLVVALEAFSVLCSYSYIGG